MTPGYKSLSDHPMISRFVKGVLNLLPSMPKYAHMWDAYVLLTYLKYLAEMRNYLSNSTVKNWSFIHVGRAENSKCS